MLSNASALIKRLTTPLWRAALVGILLGALAGGLAFQTERQTEVTALIRLYQPLDPDQIITNSAPSAETQQSYVSGEIAYLNSQGFAYAVAKQLGGPPPGGITAVQDTQSAVVNMSAIEPDFAAAQRVIDAGIDVYRNHLQEQSRDRSQAAMRAIDEVIDQLQAAPGATPDQSQNDWSQVDGNSAAETSSTESDIAARVQQLQAQRAVIDVQTRRGAPFQVVQPATATDDDGMPSWWLGAMGGGLLGGLVAIAGATAWRRREGVMTTTTAVEAHIERVLLPAVRVDRLDKSSHSYTQLARSLYAQLPSPRSGCIVLMGASAQSGTADVAALIAAAVEEHEPVRVVHLADGSAAMYSLQSPLGLGAEAATIIDGGSVDSSPTLLEAARMADQIIVVAMLGHDVLESVKVAAHLAGRSGVPVSAICTTGRPTPTTAAIEVSGRRRHTIVTPSSGTLQQS
ncbi:hypothetical protein [Mycolicibacterium stellerae]|uniref:hypothetical protein n=1 Tax=Mycolicibacterium stellerae TaxID=2358193 RepID=UPI000F0B930B|nr:hypothetical protein [Mycolicibacterium stellerae]